VVIAPSFSDRSSNAKKSISFSPNLIYLIGLRKPWRGICNRKVRRHSLTLRVNCGAPRLALANFWRGGRRTYWDLKAASSKRGPTGGRFTGNCGEATTHRQRRDYPWKQASNFSVLFQSGFAIRNRFIPLVVDGEARSMILPATAPDLLSIH
jgi:hypothetical protein